jgi:hypothetical protein
MVKAIKRCPIYGRCHMATETASHILCKCVALTEFRLSHLDKHFMEQSYYDEIPLFKTLYFVRGMVIPVE